MKVLEVIEQPFSVKALLFNKTLTIKEPTKELTLKKLRKLDEYLLSMEDVEADVQQVISEQCQKPANEKSPTNIDNMVLPSTSELLQPSCCFISS